MKKSISTLLLLSFLFNSLAFAAPVPAADAAPLLPPGIEAKNIEPEDLMAAKRVADDWIARNRAAATFDQNGKRVIQQVVLLHLGSYVPKVVRFIATYLEKSDFKVTVLPVKKEDLEKDLAANERASAVYIQDKSEELAADSGIDKKIVLEKLKEQTGMTAQRARLFLLDLMGTPSGFTLWLKLNSSPEEKRADARTATVQTAIGTAFFTLSFYLKDPSSFHAAHTLIPAMAFAGWVWLNMYKARWIGEFQSQGRDLKRVGESLPAMVKRVKSGGGEAPDPKLKVVKKPTFQRVAVYLRSVLTNSVILGSAKLSVLAFKGADEVHWTGSDTHVLFSNSLWTLFSRYAFEEWLASKQARTLSDGTVIVEAGRHEPGTTRKIRFVFETLNGFAKSLHLFQVPYADMIFPMMGIVGTINTIFDNRYWFKDKFIATKDWLVHKLTGRTRSPCVLVINSQ